MKLLALGVLLGFLIALGGDVFAHRDQEPAKTLRADRPSEARVSLSAARSS